MPNAYAELLTTPTVSRTPELYEATFDAFVAYAGGGRVADRFAVPKEVLNADYHFAWDDVEVVLELKQMAAYRGEDTVDAWFSDLLQQGRVERHTVIGPDRIRIDPESLTAAEWRRFYQRFRPSVTTHLDKAAKQLKATDGFLPSGDPARPRVFGVVLLNSRDFNLSTDLLHRLVEWRTKDKWRRGLYSRIDFVCCLSFDLVQQDRHLLHGRSIVRALERTDIVDAQQRLLDHWVHYGAAALRAEVTYDPDAVWKDHLDVGAKILGKIQRRDDR